MKEKILEALKNEKSYISGEHLSDRLMVTRASIWKNISILRKEGYHIEAQTNKGYRLILDKDVLNETEVQNELKTKVFGKQLIYETSLESTNNYAKKKMAEANLSEGAVVLCDHQTSGRGRLGRTWISDSAKNIAMSLVLKPSISPFEAQGFSLFAGVCVREAIEELTGIKADIKWPNDLLINDKKVCGILIDMNSEIEKINYLVVGIGINVYQENFSEEISSIATSLKLEKSSLEITRAKLIAKILYKFEQYYFSSDKKVDKAMLVKFKEYTNTIGKNISFEQNNETINAKVKDVMHDGVLVVEDTKGQLRNVNAGMIIYKK